LKSEIKWLNDAISSKDIVAGMSHYRFMDNELRATDGRLTAGHPWKFDGSFLVPGAELEKLLKRLPDDIKVIASERELKISSGRMRGTIQTLDASVWNYPGVEEAEWLPVPSDLRMILTDLRPFISDNATQLWATCVALDHGWAYATNNIAIAGIECEALGNIKALLPSWAIDFLLPRWERMEAWAWTDHYVAFRWENGAWMRSQLIVGEFPARAAELVRKVGITDQGIDAEYRSAFNEVIGLSDDEVLIYADHIECGFGKAQVTVDLKNTTPKDCTFSRWGGNYLRPVINAAESWTPSAWPAPAAFRGQRIAGYVVGRK